MQIDAEDTGFVKSLNALSPAELEMLSREMYTALGDMRKLEGAAMDQSDIAASLLRALSALSGYD